MKSRLCFFWICSYNGQVGTKCLFKYVSLNTLCFFSHLLFLLFHLQSPSASASCVCSLFLCICFLSFCICFLSILLFCLVCMWAALTINEAAFLWISFRRSRKHFDSKDVERMNVGRPQSHYSHYRYTFLKNGFHNYYTLSPRISIMSRFPILIGSRRNHNICRQKPREEQVCLHVSCFVQLRQNCSIIILQIFGCIVVPVARSGSIVQLRENC